MKIKFTKMHGCGNDYVYINGFEEHIDNGAKPDFVRKVSDRHFGIGSDGVIFINPSEIADFEMEMFNADGTRAEMCGNGIRSVAKYVYDRHLTDKEEMTVESMGKIKYITVFAREGKAETIKVDMGEPILDAEKIPVVSTEKRVVNEIIFVDDKEYRMTCVSMGNPHCVVFMDDIHSLDLRRIGPGFENHRLFPERVNTEFVSVLGKNRLRMRVWERGSGETLSCGSGACAAAVAAVVNGFCDKDADITVKLKGGDLVIRYSDDGILMTGDAKKDYEGIIEL